LVSEKTNRNTPHLELSSGTLIMVSLSHFGHLMGIMASNDFPSGFCASRMKVNQTSNINTICAVFVLFGKFTVAVDVKQVVPRESLFV
jgi:hypothetical protein